MEKTAREFSSEAGVSSTFHDYFLMHRERLYASAQVFGLWTQQRLGDVLEIGPFYGYIPFFLRERASSYTVLEGDDPAVYPLRPLYEKRGIDLKLVDLFDTFGPTKDAAHTLALPDASLDTILCWETMEHFNFNPVKFVRDLYRLLRPGGRVCITVPNRASLQSLIGFVFGRGERRLIEGYFTFEDYVSNGKKCFYGFHWREYTPPEIASLFSKAGFQVEECGTLFVYQDDPATSSPLKSMVRSCLRIAAPVMPRYGTTVYLVATKTA